MLDIMGSVIPATGVTLNSFIICTVASVILGAAVAYIHTIRNTFSKSFIVTLFAIPVIVEVIILLVNGNLGAGVAVAGTFSLVRFRSAPGTAREILSLFLAMATGLATGMGYILIAALLVITVGLIMAALSSFRFMQETQRTLQISIPENLDYDGVFEPVMNEYLDSYQLSNVKTAQMGTVYKLTYDVVMKQGVSTKAFIDSLRVRNGNLEISLGRHIDGKESVQL